MYVVVLGLNISLGVIIILFHTLANDKVSAEINPQKHCPWYLFCLAGEKSVQKNTSKSRWACDS